MTGGGVSSDIALPVGCGAHCTRCSKDLCIGRGWGEIVIEVDLVEVGLVMVLLPVAYVYVDG